MKTKHSIYTIIFAASFLFFGCELENIDIDRFGVIVGTVVDGETYEPLQGVQITTTPSSTSLLTDENGAFTINRMLAGNVVINARKRDYLTSSVSVAVYEHDTTEVKFFLLEDLNDVGDVVIYDPVPGNGAVDQPRTLTFRWSVDQANVDRELEYTVYMFTSNSTTQTVVGENLLAREVIVADLTPVTTYYWYVVAKHDGRRVANSPTWTFRTE